MRTLLALILLAGTATPALAAGDPGDTIRSISNRQQAKAEARSERSEASGDRQAVRGSRSDDGGGHQPRPVRVESGDGGNSGENRSNRSLRDRFSGGEPPAIQPSGSDSISSESVRNWRSQERERTRGPRIVEAPQGMTEGGDAPTLREQRRALPSVLRNRVPIVSSTPSEGTQPPLRAESRRTNWVNWSTSRWRSDHRYNWREHRRRHRSIFHLGFYYDPFGWNYRPYQIGWRLWPSYYSRRYWLHDPWYYRLPYAPPGYRWIRYHDDALLVDTWDGRVVDVIYNFFW